MIESNAIPPFNLLKSRRLVDATKDESVLTVKQQIVQTDANEAKAVVYSLFDKRTYLFSVLQTGSDMYVIRSSESLSIIKPQDSVPVNSSLKLLTRREEEVLLALSRGQCAKKVAQTLSISYQTVRTHQKNIYKKLGVNSLLEAIKVFTIPATSLS